MIQLQSNSIQTRLTRMSMLVGSSALLFACIGFVVYELIAFRTAMVRGLTTQAQIVGWNSVTALTFADPHSAETTLAALRAEPSISTAGLYERTGKLFASFRRERTPDTLPALAPDPGATDAYQFDGGRLFVSHAIFFDRDRIGTVYIQADLQEMYTRFARYGLIAGVVLVASLLLAFLLSAKLQRPISGTVLHLAETARVISDKKDYSVRAVPPKTADELAVLTQTFNEMLSQIQQQNEALEQARQQVELRVEERTAELRQSEERFRLLIEGVNDYAIFMLDSTGHVASWSAAAERINGYRADEIIGQAFSCFYPPEDLEKSKPAMELARAASEGRFEGEGWRVRKDGSRVWANVSITAMRDDQGNLLGFWKIARDLTDRKLAEDRIRKLNDDLERRGNELEATNKELEAFSYSVSHDLRAPLRAIDGFSRILLEDYNDRLDGDGQDQLNRIRVASQRMGVLIDALLNLARLTRNQIQRQPTDLSVLANSVIAELRRAEPERPVQVAIERGLEVNADANLMRIVLENLIGNAWKFTKKSSEARVELSALRNGGDTIFFVRDNGAGFDMAYSNKLFGAFQRLHDRKEFDGTGIGLATVQRIIRRHGGRVWAEGNVNKGATFYFTLAG